MILSTIVGSRLHGTATPESDWDYRGVFIVPLHEKLSPFKEQKEAHWVEGAGDTDDTAYELSKFCKMAVQGNPSCLEVLVGLPHSSTALGEELKSLLPKFISKKRCFDAFMGYSRNQEKKFRDDAGGRKWKYATAHVRTLYQLLRLLETGELVGTYSDGVAEELRHIKSSRKLEREVMARVFTLEELCRSAFRDAKLPEEPDIPAIEAFIHRAYTTT